MKLLAVHPSGLMFTQVYLRLEPLGLELVAAAARRAGHEVRLCDLQAEPQARFFRMMDGWRPDAICFSGNYLANIPEIIDLAKAAKNPTVAAKDPATAPAASSTPPASRVTGWGPRTCRPSMRTSS